MSKSEAAKVAGRLQGGPWGTPGIPDRVAAYVQQELDALEKRQDTGREVELERQLSAYSGQIRELERQLAEARTLGLRFAKERDEARELVVRNSTACDDLLATAYVTREVPWSDVAAGMMTLSRDGTPWMVQGRVGEQVFLRQGEKSFPKDSAPGETVRVLEPYVTPEQAEELVRGQLGGTEVGA